MTQSEDEEDTEKKPTELPTRIEGEEVALPAQNDNFDASDSEMVDESEQDPETAPIISDAVEQPFVADQDVQMEECDQVSEDPSVQSNQAEPDITLFT